MSFFAPYAKSLLPPDSHDRHVAGHHIVLCAGLADNLRAARAVIVVRVADEQNLDVAEAEAKRLNALANQRRGRREIAVDEDEAFGRGDEVRGEIAAADVIEIARDAEGRKGLSPGRVWICAQICGMRKKQTRKVPAHKSACLVS